MLMVKCFAQEHNTTTLPGFKPTLLNPESGTLNVRDPPPLHSLYLSPINYCEYFQLVLLRHKLHHNPLKH